MTGNAPSRRFQQVARGLSRDLGGSYQRALQRLQAAAAVWDRGGPVSGSREDALREIARQGFALAAASRGLKEAWAQVERAAAYAGIALWTDVRVDEPDVEAVTAALLSEPDRQNAWEIVERVDGWMAGRIDAAMGRLFADHDGDVAIMFMEAQVPCPVSPSPISVDGVVPRVAGEQILRRLSAARGDGPRALGEVRQAIAAAFPSVPANPHLLPASSLPLSVEPSLAALRTAAGRAWEREMSEGSVAERWGWLMPLAAAATRPDASVGDVQLLQAAVFELAGAAVREMYATGASADAVPARGAELVRALGELDEVDDTWALAGVTISRLVEGWTPAIHDRIEAAAFRGLSPDDRALELLDVARLCVGMHAWTIAMGIEY